MAELFRHRRVPHPPSKGEGPDWPEHVEKRWIQEPTPLMQKGVRWGPWLALSGRGFQCPGHRAACAQRQKGSRVARHGGAVLVCLGAP